MRTRPARLGDVPGIQAVAKRTWRAAYADLLGEETVRAIRDHDGFYARERVESTVTATDATYLIAVEDETVRGYADITWSEAWTDRRAYVPVGSAELRALYVLPDRWREGHGTRLLDHVLAELPDDIDRLYVRYFAENDRARAFYADHDFREIAIGHEPIAGEEYAIRIAVLEH